LTLTPGGGILFSPADETPAALETTTMTDIIATATPSPAQSAYFLALAAYESVLAEMHRRCPDVPDGASDEECAAAWAREDEVSAELRIADFRNALNLAERAVLAWSFTVARKTAGRSKSKLAAIAEVEAGIEESRHFNLRCRAIDIALRLAA
jgi:hypothetical protein